LIERRRTPELLISVRKVTHRRWQPLLSRQPKRPW